MKTVQIKLSTIEDVRNFVTILSLSHYAVDLDLKSGRYIVDARSLMGIFSLDLLKPIDFVINSDDEKVINAVLNDVKKWIVSETEPEKPSDLKVGDKIKILSSAEKYATGETIPDRLKGATDEIMQFSKDNKSVLLKGINSWVWAKDVASVKK